MNEALLVFPLSTFAICVVFIVNLVSNRRMRRMYEERQKTDAELIAALRGLADALRNKAEAFEGLAEERGKMIEVLQGEIHT